MLVSEKAGTKIDSNLMNDVIDILLTERLITADDISNYTFDVTAQGTDCAKAHNLFVGEGGFSPYDIEKIKKAVQIGEFG